MAILYEKRGRVAYITINRPEARNAVDPETLQELSDACFPDIIPPGKTRP